MIDTTFAKAVADEDRELEIVETMLKSMGLLNRYKVVQRSKKVPLSRRELIEIGQRIIKEAQQQTATNGGCQNGVNCGEEFKQINEGLLIDYLREGWQVVHRLQSGELIVKLTQR